LDIFPVGAFFNTDATDVFVTERKEEEEKKEKKKESCR
jgi:hypothetical protein